MRLIHFKSLLVVALLLIVAFLLIMMCVSCVSGEKIVLEAAMSAVNSPQKILYYPVINESGTVFDNYGPQYLGVRDVEKIKDADEISFTWNDIEGAGLYDGDEGYCYEDCFDSYWFNGYPCPDYENEYWLKGDGERVANITIGYNKRSDGTYYCALYLKEGSKTDWWDTATGNKLLSIEGQGYSHSYTCWEDDNDISHWTLCGNWNIHGGVQLDSGTNWYDYLESGQAIFLGVATIAFAKGNVSLGYDSEYAIDTYINFYQPYRIIEVVPGFDYRIEYDKRTNSRWSTKVMTWNDDYTFFNQSVIYDCQNITTYVHGDAARSLCENGIRVKCTYADGYWFERVHTDFCGAEIEPGYFDLQGYTRNIYNNIINNVYLECQDKNTTSNEIGFYTFTNLETGYFWVNATKSGFYDSNNSLLIGKSNLIYQYDIYMIPLDALDTGEFGGIVYDYCTLEPIENSYVYLLNKTSGDESYIITNENGFYKFSNLVEDMDYSVRASKVGYEESMIYGFTFNETTDKVHNIWLLPEGGCPDEPIPTVPPPTPTPPIKPTPSPIPDIIFDLLGIENGDYLLALLAIGLMAGIFGKFSHFNPIVTALGGFFGFIFSILMEWIPSELLGVVIVIIAAVIAAMIIKARG